MMQAGKLDTRLSVQAISTTQDAVGQPINTWTEFARIWADVRYSTGLQATKADADTSKAKCSIRIRHRTDITEAHRLVDLVVGTVYAIQSKLPDRRAGHIDLVCEVVS